MQRSENSVQRTADRRDRDQRSACSGQRTVIRIKELDMETNTDINTNTNTVKSFKDLIVWVKSHELTLEIYKVTKKFPADEK